MRKGQHIFNSISKSHDLKTLSIHDPFTGEVVDVFPYINFHQIIFYMTDKEFDEIMFNLNKSDSKNENNNTSPDAINIKQTREACGKNEHEISEEDEEKLKAEDKELITKCTKCGKSLKAIIDGVDQDNYLIFEDSSALESKIKELEHKLSELGSKLKRKKDDLKML